MKHFNYFRMGLLLSLLAMGAISSVYAQKVDSITALNIASSYLRQPMGNKALARVYNEQQLSIAYTAQNADETYYYAINNGTDGGYVIVSGHDAAQEVLGYVEDGHFDYDSIPTGMQWLLGIYQKQIHAMYSDGELANESRKQRRIVRAARATISNFVTLRWGQMSPYNFGITGGKNSYPIGCVNTATSMIMKYYNHPAQATNPAMGTLRIGSTTAKAIEANRKLNFSSMTSSYSSSTTSYSGANKAVADLMYLVARLNETEFSTSESGASDLLSAENMIDYLGYDKTMEYLYKEDFTETEWDNLMYAEMVAKRPVLYTGEDTAGKGGHAFLLTGYKDSKYYINWGWQGTDNGLFALSACNAEGYKFNDMQTAATHIMKDAGGILSVQINYYDVSNEEVGVGQLLHTSVNYNSKTVKTPVYSWQVKLKNMKTGIIVPLYLHKNRPMYNSIDEFESVRDTIPADFIPGNKYEVLLYYQNGDGPWEKFEQDSVLVITIKNQVNFKSYSLDKADARPGSQLQLNYTYNKESAPLSIPYDLCVKLTNLTQGTDTILVLKKDFKLSSSNRDLSYKLPFFIPVSFYGGDRVKIEFGYRVSGTTVWDYIDQSPINIELLDEVEMLSYQIDLNGDQHADAFLPYSFSYNYYTTNGRTVDFAIHYEGMDDSLDSIVVMKTKIPVLTGMDKSYSYAYGKLINTLAENKSYKLTGLWRINGEKVWHTFPVGASAQIRIIPIISFSSFAMTKKELPLAACDTVTFKYSCFANNISQHYKLGVHLKGTASKVDTIMVLSNSYDDKVGDNKVFEAEFTVPSSLWIDEEVELTGCYQEPNGIWTDITQQPSTFRVTNCYKFENSYPGHDQLPIGVFTKFHLKFESLHDQIKPDYHLAVKMHNLTTNMPDTICVLTTDFSDMSLTEKNSLDYNLAYYGTTIPLTFNDGDTIETTILYKTSNMPEWIADDNCHHKYMATDIWLWCFRVEQTEVSPGGDVPIVYKYVKTANTKIQPYDLGLRLTNLTQQVDTMIVVKENDTSASETFPRSLTFHIPEKYAIGDTCQVEAYYRKSGTSKWEHIKNSLITINIGVDIEFQEYKIYPPLKTDNSLESDSKITLILKYVCRFVNIYEIGIQYKGIDYPYDSIVAFPRYFSGSTSQTEARLYTSLPQLEPNTKYRLTGKYRPLGQTEWMDLPGGIPIEIPAETDIEFHSYEHPKDEVIPCSSDTILYNYKTFDLGFNTTYFLGAHLIGQTSGIDTIVVCADEYKNKKYFQANSPYWIDKTSCIHYDLPSNLQIGEQVLMQLCWTQEGASRFEPDETNWKPIVDEYKTFTVADCYRFTGYTSKTKTIRIGENCTIDVNYNSLTSMTKPKYKLGVRIHNLTTSETEDVICVDSLLCDDASPTGTGTKSVTFTMPRNYDVGDMVEVTILYRAESTDIWKTIHGNPIFFEMEAPESDVVLLNAPEVANDGYITSKNFNYHLVFKNFSDEDKNRQINVEVYQNESYKGDVSCSFEIGAHETKEIIITPSNCSSNIFTRLPAGIDYNFRIYDATDGKYHASASQCPLVHLLTFGDVTRDGINDIDDIKAVKQYLLNPVVNPLSTISKIAADGNSDGRITIEDMVLIIDAQNKTKTNLNPR